MLKTSVCLGLAPAVTALTASVASAQEKKDAKKPDDKIEEYDVIVLGAGVGGLVTAIAAKQAGAKKVVLFEKMDRPDGNAIYALGSVCGWGSRHQLEQGIKDNAEDFFKMMMNVSKQMGDRALNLTYTDNIPQAIDWLESDIGVPFGKIQVMPYPRLGRTCRVEGKGITGGAMLVKKLLEAADKNGVEIKFQHKGIKLLHNDKLEVTGVRVLAPDGAKDYKSKGGVAIATGGFSANPELVDRYIGGWATRMVLRGSRVVTGENITLVLPLYAKCVNLDQFHAGPIIAASHVNPADVLNSGYGIQVNTNGDRYMDEHNTYVIKARTTAQKTLDNKAWVIVDSQCPVLNKVIPKFDRLNSPYGKADTLEELAKQVGLPPEKIVKDVEEYNKAVKDHTLADLDPPNTYPKPFPIDKPPYYAIPMEGGMTATFGGPLINPRAEVQNLDGKSIPGLYAVGNSIGGIFFNDYAGGAQLGAATVFGRIAGKQMADRAAKQGEK
ncbi:MAG: FAD-dependent oxidoreductase [Burkholderiales bacterium]|nr:FAD-dependent oxidoreductase [Burkholderiales bacterium]